MEKGMKSMKGMRGCRKGKGEKVDSRAADLIFREKEKGFIRASRCATNRRTPFRIAI